MADLELAPKGWARRVPGSKGLKREGIFDGGSCAFVWASLRNKSEAQAAQVAFTVSILLSGVICFLCPWQCCSASILSPQTRNGCVKLGAGHGFWLFLAILVPKHAFQ